MKGYLRFFTGGFKIPLKCESMYSSIFIVNFHSVVSGNYSAFFKILFRFAMQTAVVMSNVAYYKPRAAIRRAKFYQLFFEPYILFEIHMVNVIITAHSAVRNYAIELFTVI